MLIKVLHSKIKAFSQKYVVDLKGESLSNMKHSTNVLFTFVSHTAV